MSMSISISQFLPHSSPKPQFRIRSCYTIPARDRVIDFGKHKGKMLGTLPSTYLKWVSSNLRARDFQHWADLADNVLSDPVYQDRIQWEFAQKILNGDVSSSPLSPSSSSAVSSLVEISERFGWDNDDKLAWKRVNFELLGTSKGGRIPRIGDKGEEELGNVERKVVEGRDERRERIRMKTRRSKGEIPIPIPRMVEGEVRSSERPSLSFPGREGLLRRVMDAKGRRPSI